MLKLVTLEAQAYLKLGLMAPARRRVQQTSGQRARAGVLFVPGEKSISVPGKERW